MGTSVRVPNKHESPPKLIMSPQDRQQHLALGKNLIVDAEPCYPHDNIVGGHLCDE